MYRSKSSLDLLLEEIKNVISNRFSDFFQEKDDMEKILLNLPIYKRLINENQNLIEKIKDLELELIEKRTENNVKKKIELKISEKPLDKNNIIKKESLKKNADEIFLKLNVYNSDDDSDMLSSDEDDDVKPIQITNNYSSMVQNLTVDVKNIEKEKIKNEKELLLELTNNKKKTLKSSNSWLSNVGEEMRRRKNEKEKMDLEDDPQIKQLKFLTNNEESVNDEQDEYIDINDMEEEDLDDGEAEDEEEVEEEDEEEEVEEEDEEEEDEEEDDEEEEEVEEEEDEEEDEEEEVEEEEDEEEEELEVDEFVDADGIKYWVTDSKNGDVYEFLKDGDIGDEIGKLQNGVLFLS